MEDEKKCYPNFDSKIYLRSCKKEIIEPIRGTTSGTIPSWINGVLIRNGPGLLEIGNYSFQHVFDGLAMLQRFEIRDGNVTYQCRFLQTESYKRSTIAKRIVFTGLGTSSVPDPCHTIFKRIAANFYFDRNLADNTDVSLFPFGDELYALTEIPIIYRINQTTLATEKKVDIKDNVFIVNHSAHPHVVKGGNVYNLAMSVTKTGPNHNIVCFPAPPNKGEGKHSMFEQARIVATIPARWPFHPSYMHCFGITKNYFIIVEQPLCLSVSSMLINRVMKNGPLLSGFQWYGDEMVQFNVISRRTGKLAFKYYSETFCYFHIINQYEVSNHIVIDICTYKDPSALQFMYTETMANIQKYPNYASLLKIRPLRFILPLVAPEGLSNVRENCIKLPNTKAEAYLTQDGNIFVKPESLCNAGCELPTINYETYSGKEYRFYYSITMDIDAENPGMIVKVNTHSKTELTWHEKNCYLSEPIFIPQPNSQSEDDGVVLAAMLWGGDETNRTGLLVLDAKTFRELGRVEFQTPSPVPKCIHGWFLPNRNV